MPQLTGEEVQRLRALRIGLVCDLRREEERRRVPQAGVSELGAEVLHLDVNRGRMRADVQSLVQQLLAAPKVAHLHTLLQHTYRDMPAAFHGVCQPLFEQLVAPERKGALIHCTAGKDRTGFLVALILLALDIEPEAIFEDYLRSASPSCLQAFADHGRGMLTKLLACEPDPELVTVISGVHRDYLASALDQLRQDYGTVEAYLTQALGIDASRRRASQERWLA